MTTRDKDREQRIVHRYLFGKDGVPETMEAIGHDEGITRERVRQIIDRAEGIPPEAFEVARQQRMEARRVDWTCECGTTLRLPPHAARTRSQCSRDCPARRTSDNELIAEMLRVARIVDRTPSMGDMIEHGYWSAQTFIVRFGSWGAACEAAGLEPRPQHVRSGR